MGGSGAEFSRHESTHYKHQDHLSNGPRGDYLDRVRGTGERPNSVGWGLEGDEFPLLQNGERGFHFQFHSGGSGRPNLDEEFSYKQRKAKRLKSTASER